MAIRLPAVLTETTTLKSDVQLSYVSSDAESPGSKQTPSVSTKPKKLLFDYVHIGPHRVAVYVKRMKKDWGRWQNGDVYLSPDIPNRDMLADVLVHEVSHAIEDFALLNLNHTKLNVWCMLLCQALRNYIDPDWERFKELRDALR